MRPHAVDDRPPAISRRRLLQAAGFALAARFTALSDELAALLMRWWLYRPIPLLAGAI